MSRIQTRALLVAAILSLCSARAATTDGTVSDLTDAELYGNSASKSLSDDAGVWAVDPKVPGDDRPKVGRSLFETVFSKSSSDSLSLVIPYPFPALLQVIEQHATKDDAGFPTLKHVFIPLGRSLQRQAAAPEYFSSPRIVVAVDTEPTTGSNVVLKNRLFLGYQERAESIEVISYNEAEGRFEFQIVQDYKPGGVPTLVNAKRTICLSCHQNAGPIFARRNWDETHANLEIASRLKREYEPSAPLALNPDHAMQMAFDIDIAVAKANSLLASQFLWRHGCEAGDERNRSSRCRAGLLFHMLQYRLSGYQHFDTRATWYQKDVLPVLQSHVDKKWLGNIKVPNPFLPNRDPINSETTLTSDPLTRRPPLRTRKLNDPKDVERMIEDLASFLSEPDIRELDGHLVARRDPSNQRWRYQTPCDVDSEPVGKRIWMSFRCQTTDEGLPAFAMESHLVRNGTNVVPGRIRRMSVGPNTWIDSVLIDGGKITQQDDWTSVTLLVRQKFGGYTPRDAQGNAIEKLQLRWRARSLNDESAAGLAGEVLLTMIDDFGPIRLAMESMASPRAKEQSDLFSNRPFRRATLLAALYARLGIPAKAWCCADDGVSIAQSEGEGNLETAARITHGKTHAVDLFQQHCGSCHRTNQRFPPNFLAGDDIQVETTLKRCAERIFVRLNTWRVPVATRTRSPMPPAAALLEKGHTPQQWRDSAALAELIAYVGDHIPLNRNATLQSQPLLDIDYSKLPPCIQ